MKTKAVLAALLFGAVLFAYPNMSHAQTNLLTNGDFEDLTGWEPAGGPATTAPVGWRDATTFNNAASPQTGANAIGGSGTSASMVRTGLASEPDSTSGRMGQILDQQSGPVYEWSFDFASEDPGGPANRSLSLAIYHGEGATTLIMRLADDFDDGIGDWQVFSQGLWLTAVPDAVIFDDDVSVDPLVHNFAMTIDSTAETPHYDMRITDSNGVVHELLDSTMFHGTTPGPINEGGVRIEWVNQLSNIGTDYLIDNVSLITLEDFPTEPGDFDNDGDVDGADFLVWQRGESPDPLSASDLSDWENAFGGGAELSASVASIPEPCTAVLVCLAVGVGMAVRRRTM